MSLFYNGRYLTFDHFWLWTLCLLWFKEIRLIMCSGVNSVWFKWFFICFTQWVSWDPTYNRMKGRDGGLEGGWIVFSKINRVGWPKQVRNYNYRSSQDYTPLSMFSSTLQGSLFSNKGVELARDHLTNCRSKVTQTYATSTLSNKGAPTHASKQKHKAT